MPSTPRLYLQAVVDGTFDDVGDLLCGLRVGDGRWLRRYSEVVWLDVRKLEQRITIESHITTHGILQALLH